MSSPNAQNNHTLSLFPLRSSTSDSFFLLLFSIEQIIVIWVAITLIHKCLHTHFVDSNSSWEFKDIDWECCDTLTMFNLLYLMLLTKLNAFLFDSMCILCNQNRFHFKYSVYGQILTDELLTHSPMEIIAHYNFSFLVQMKCLNVLNQKMCAFYTK